MIEKYNIDTIKNIITYIRNIRNEYGIRKDKLNIIIDIKNININNLLLCKMDSIIIKMTNVNIEWDIYMLLERGNYFEYQNIDNIDIYIELPGINKLDKTLLIDNEINRLSNQIQTISKKLDNFGFIEKAPLEIILKEKHKIKSMIDKRNTLSNINLYQKCGLLYHELISRIGIDLIKIFLNKDTFTEYDIINLHKDIYKSKYLI